MAKTNITYYVPLGYPSPRLHVFEELMGQHLDEIDKSIRAIHQKQLAHITKNFTLKIIPIDLKALDQETNQEIIQIFSSKGLKLPIVLINGRVKKLGKFLSPTELAQIFDGFSVQIPNDPDA